MNSKWILRFKEKKEKKMKRKSVAIAVIAFVILACVALTACFGTSSSNSGSSTGRRISVNIYECNGMGYTANDFVTNDLKFTKPTTEPTKEGYVFDGWYLDEERTIALVVGQKISDDDDSVSIYPKWTVATLQVKVIDELNGNEVYTVNYGETIDLGEPTKPFGYVFGGYFTDEERTKAFDTNTKIKEETILYIKWVGEEYDINYVMNGGEFDEDEEVSTKYTAGAEVQLPVAQKSGYIFDGWCLEEDLSDESITSLSGASGDKTLYAKYVCDLANITIITGVSAKNGDVYSFETDYTAHSVNIFNYFTFSDNANVKVYENGDLLNAEKIAFEENDGIGTIERTFSVVVVSESGKTEHEYSVKAKQHDESTVFVYYIVDGETKHTDSMYVGSVAVNKYSYDDEKEGYAFAYWSEEENGENAYVFGKIILNNDPITLYAVFKPVKYTVTYSLGAAINDEDNPTEYTIASDITLEEPTVPNGYTFVGWFTNDEYETKVTKLGGTTGDVTLYAQYTKAEKWNFEKTGDKYEVTAEEYPDLLDYLVFSRETAVKVHITSGYASTGEGFITAAKGDVSIGHTTNAKCEANGDEADITLTFGYNTIINPTDKTDSGTYEQIPFIYMVNAETGLGNAFADFPIDHIGAELTVSDSEQLFFALENGYRPVCEAGSVAETLYEEMKNILREILDPGMTEKEICVAIAQYLVDTIEYDNKVLEMFEEVYDELALAYEQKEAAVTKEEKEEADKAIAKANANRKTLAGYKSFYLEGAIFDGVAVCDGISKAFTSLTRIMGIESYQVSGRLSGVNHAWNKVFVDLDGNGTKEWTAVDCTGANTALGRGEEKETVEIMNYFYIFATDDFLVTQGYEYADEWDGKFVVVVDYNVYNAFEYDTEKTYYVETKNELNDIMEFYKDEFDATEESALSISIRMPKTLGMDENKISSNVVEALQLAMFTVDQINNHTSWSCTVVDTNDVVITFFIEK